jgi:hypothetical protein
MIYYRVEYKDEGEKYGNKLDTWSELDKFTRVEEAWKRISYEKRSHPYMIWRIMKVEHTEEEVGNI